MDKIKVENRGRGYTVDEPLLGYSKIEIIGHALDRLDDWHLTYQMSKRC